MVGAQLPSYPNNPVSLSFDDPNRAPSTSAPCPYPYPALPPNVQQHPSITVLSPHNHVGPGAYGMTPPPLVQPAPFTMPSMPLGTPQAMAGGGPPGMMPPHQSMVPGMPPLGQYSMPQPPPGSVRSPIPNEIPSENVLRHLNRKKNLLKFFPGDDSQQAHSKDASLPPSASTVFTPYSLASATASAHLSSDDCPSVANRSQTSSRASLNLLGPSLSPCAPPQPRHTPSVTADRGQSAASLGTAAGTTALLGARRIVYTREALLELRSKSHHSVSAHTLDRIKHMKLDLNCAAMAFGGKAVQLPFATGRDLPRRFPMGKVAGATHERRCKSSTPWPTICRLLPPLLPHKLQKRSDALAPRT
jgi:hypothetical protein